VRALTNKLKYLIKISLNKKIKTKWFAIVNILLVILIAGLINIDTIISAFGGDFNEPTNIIIKDNTGKVYDGFKANFELTQNQLKDLIKTKIEVSNKTKEELIEDINDSKKVAIIIDNDETNFIKAQIISEAFIDNILYQIITSSINTTKVTLAMVESNIDPNELAAINTPIKVDRQILDESKSEQEDTMSFFMGIIFPSFIMPFFMLVVFSSLISPPII
jgi:ABC-type Na+ efflux pump permease subunit